jgi:hypothetical protein
MTDNIVILVLSVTCKSKQVRHACRDYLASSRFASLWLCLRRCNLRSRRMDRGKMAPLPAHSVLGLRCRGALRACVRPILGSVLARRERGASLPVGSSGHSSMVRGRNCRLPLGKLPRPPVASPKFRACLTIVGADRERWVAGCDSRGGHGAPSRRYAAGA